MKNTILLVTTVALFGCEPESNDSLLFPNSESITTIEKFGIAPTFQGEITDLSSNNIEESFIIASKIGADVVHIEFEWGQLEREKDNFDWSLSDVEMNKINELGLKSSVVLSTIKTEDLAVLPEDFVFNGFADTEIKDRYSTLVLAFLERYNGKVDYLWFGNEVDVFFNENKEVIPAYKQFTKEIKDIIKTPFPNVKTGLIFTYHDAVNNDSLEIIEAFDELDITGLTFFLQFLSNSPDTYPIEFEKLVQFMKTLGLPFAITETTWSSKGFDGSVANQEIFIKNAIDTFLLHKDSLEFFTIFGIFDFPRSFVESSFPGFPELIDWLSTLSFVNNDGAPKPSWFVLLDALKKL